NPMRRSLALPSAKASTPTSFASGYRFTPPRWVRALLPKRQTAPSMRDVLLPSHLVDRFPQPRKSVIHVAAGSQALMAYQPEAVGEGDLPGLSGNLQNALPGSAGAEYPSTAKRLGRRARIGLDILNQTATWLK